MDGGGLSSVNAFFETRQVQLQDVEEYAMSKASLFPILTLALTGMNAVCAQERGVRHLTLTEAVQLAIAQNHDLKIARLKVVEAEQRKAVAKSNYFPELKNESGIHRSTAL